MNFEDILKLLKSDTAEDTVCYGKLRSALLSLEGVYDPDKYRDGTSSDDLDMNEVTTYRRKLGKALDAATFYLKHFNDDPNGKSGVDRKQLAQAVKSELSERYNRAIEAEIQASEKNKTAEAELIKLLKERPNPDAENKAKSFSEMADLRKNVGGTGLKVKENTFKPENYSGKGAWSKFKYGLSWAFSRLSVINFTLWLGAKAATARNISRNIRRVGGSQYDSSLVPGSRNEHFENPDETKRKVDRGPADQPVLDDRKRAPLVFERVVPGDVNAKPTLTIKSSQAALGDTLGYDGNSEATGHAFITLNYTKTNPLTGKPERYELTMGFFPKGGFDAISIAAAEKRAGLFVPGQINSDFYNIYDAAKTIEIDNKRVNQILLASQEYEKGGYNSIKRNCTTFAHDMAKIADPTIDRVMQTSEVTTKHTFFSDLGLHFAGSLLVRNGVNEMLKKAGREDYSYQRAGQKMVTENEVQKLDLLEHHQRMIGYVPGHVVESFRNEEGFQMNARGSIALHPTSMSDGFTVTVGQVEHVLSQFQDRMNTFKRKHRRTPGVASVIDNFNAYLANKYGELRVIGNDAYKVLPTGSLGGDEPRTIAFSRKKMLNGIQVVNETVKHINEVYQDAFKSDPGLNVEFSKVVGGFNAVKALFENDYTRIEDRLRFRESRPIDNKYQSDYDAYVDQKRPDADAVIRMNFQEFTFGTDRIKLTPIEIAATIKTYGSLAAYNRYKRMGNPSKGALKTWDKENRDFYHKMSIRSRAFDAYVAAGKSVFTNRKPYKMDYEMAFIDIPKNEKVFANSGFKLERPSLPYQMVLLDHVYGSREKADGTLEKNNIQEKLVEALNKKDLTKEAQEEEFKKTLNDALVENITHNGEFDKLEGVFVTNIMEDMEKQGYKNNPLVVQANVKNQASSLMMDALKNVYIKNICNQIKEKNLPVPETIDLETDPAFASFRKTYEEKTGVQIEIHKMRHDSYKALYSVVKPAFNAKQKAFTEEQLSAIRPLLAKTLLYSMVSTTGVVKPLTEENMTAQANQIIQKPGFDNLLEMESIHQFIKSYDKNRHLAVTNAEETIQKQIMENKELRLLNETKAPEKKADAREKEKAPRLGGKKR